LKDDNSFNNTNDLSSISDSNSFKINSVHEVYIENFCRKSYMEFLQKRSLKRQHRRLEINVDDQDIINYNQKLRNSLAYRKIDTNLNYKNDLDEFLNVLYNESISQNKGKAKENLKHIYGDSSVIPVYNRDSYNSIRSSNSSRDFLNLNSSSTSLVNQSSNQNRIINNPYESEYSISSILISILILTIFCTISYKIKKILLEKFIFFKNIITIVLIKIFKLIKFIINTILLILLVLYIKNT
jgi:hypothetical protein